MDRRDAKAARADSSAQTEADRLRLLREELLGGETAEVLELSPEQRDRFDRWSALRLQELARRFDVDVTASQKKFSWGMRIASTIGALAICAAIVLFFMRYWGYMETSQQVAVVFLLPLALIAAAEWISRREQQRYLTGLTALAALASFVLDLSVIGSIFNISSTENALLAWGLFAWLLAWRYRMKLLMAIALSFLTSYVAAAFTGQLGYRWLDFYDRPELFIMIAALVFSVPFWLRTITIEALAGVFRFVGAVAILISMLSLAEWGVPSYLPWETAKVERLYEVVGLLSAASAIWLGIRRGWNAIVNTGAVFFTMFLFARLYHWWWEWMPHYLFFAVIGAIGIGLVLAFKRLRQAPVMTGAIA